MAAGEKPEDGVPDGVVVDNGPDDGFSPEERAQFAEMQNEPAVPPPEENKPEGEPDAGSPDADRRGESADGGDDEDSGEPAKDGKPSRRVSRARHEKELASRDAEIAALKDANKTNAEMQARLDERMKIINEALTPKQQRERENEDPEPDPEEDIFAHNQWLRRQLVNTQQAVRELHGGLQQRDTQSGVERTYVNDAQRFAAQEPRFVEAYQFLMASRVAELAIYRFGKEDPSTLTPQEMQAIGRIVEAEENQLVQAALQGGRSPAQQLFSLARARGYRPPADEAKTNTNGHDKSNGLAAAPNGADGKPSVKDEIARVKKGVEASVSLSNAGGAPAMVLTPEKLANMPQDEFNALMDSLDEGDQKRVMGGR